MKKVNHQRTAMSNFNASMNRRFTSSSARRGSVLIIVVAILTLIALMGTAYIAVARLDRSASIGAVQTAQIDALHNQLLGQVTDLVNQAITNDNDDAAIFNITSLSTPAGFHNNNTANFASVTHPSAQPWLADRLPRATDFFINSPPTSPIPMWRFISGQLKPEMFEAYHSPLSGPAFYDGTYVRCLANPATVAGSHRATCALVPDWVSITYPSTYSDRPDLAGKTRTFPAAQFIDPANPAVFLDPFTGLAPVGPAKTFFLAADADGDGITDSVLFQITQGPVNGVSYFAAVRIIDNNSALNVKTARFRRMTDGAAAPVANNQSFFPTNIGLYELFDSQPDPISSNSRSYNNDEIVALDQYRFGYADIYTDPFKPAVPQAIVAGSMPINDDGSFRNTPGNMPPAPPDFQFSTQAEAFYMQVGRRIANPGYNYDANINSHFPFRSFTSEDAARLAYKGGMVLSTASLVFNVSPMDSVNPPANNFATEIDRRLWHSAFQSTPNFTWDPAKRWTTFPADTRDFWFLGLNFDHASPVAAPAAPANGYYDYTALAGAVNLGTLSPNLVRYRSIRPLLTAYNPVSNLYNAKTNTNPTITWNMPAPYSDVNMLNPGMMPNDMALGFPSTLPWLGAAPPKAPTARPDWYYNAAQAYAMYDVVYDVNTQLSYISMQPNNANHAPASSDPWYWEPQGKVGGNTRTSVNVANFPELWRSFMQIMSAPGSSGTAAAVPTSGTMNAFFGNGFIQLPPGTPPGTQSTPTPVLNPALMFRSCIRDVNVPAGNYLSEKQMLVLRSAIAAVNTIALEQLPTAPPPVRKITLYATGTATPVFKATLFGIKPQPFLTEVYANNDPYYADPTDTVGANPQGYIALELYNPYTAVLDIGNWQIWAMDRTATGYVGTTTPVLVATVPAGTTIPALGYLVLENYSTAGNPNDATHAPIQADTSITANGATRLYLPLQQILYNAAGLIQPKEFVLVRPVTTPGGSTEFMPIDSFDFTGWTGITPAPATPSGDPQYTVTQWHYVRANGPGQPWQCVYPGRYDATIAPRHQGTFQDTFVRVHDSSAAGYNESDFDWGPASAINGSINLGALDTTPTFVNGSNGNFTIQICTPGMPGPNSPGVVGPPYYYPFGGFTRPVDLLQVPFIGAYTIQPIAGLTGRFPELGVTPAPAVAGTPLVEINSLSMDSAFAEDTDTSNDPTPSGAGVFFRAEQIGRFCPVGDAVARSLDFDDTGTSNWRYRWTTQLFTFLGVGTPSQDFLPDTNPATYPQQQTNPLTLPPNPKAVQATPSSFSGQSDANANQTNDDAVGTQGLININTAPPAVLKMLPMTPDGSGGVDNSATAGIYRNDALAQQIAQWRDSAPSAAVPAPPFRSIYDLNNVVDAGTKSVAIFRDAATHSAAPGVVNWPQNAGDFITGSGVLNDFEAGYLMANRVSNMITTRSDTFTCYILIQGWRNAGTPYPALEWEQRKAFIIDRSMRKGPNDTTPLKIIPVPTD